MPEEFDNSAQIAAINEELTTDFSTSQRRAETAASNVAAERAAAITATQPADTVLVTVTKFGAGKVSTGEHVAGVGDVLAKRGDILEVAKHVAGSLEAKGFAETE